MRLSEINSGTELVFDAEIGCTPHAPTLMKTADAKIRGTDDSILIEVDDVYLEYNRD